MKQILFSCLGTTDPVRGEHDGPMLHILRHYRPEGAYLFLTPEIREMAGKDSRFEKTGSWIATHWGGYRPEIRYIDSSVRNAHDIDELDRPLYEAMALISRENPEAEILINLTDLRHAADADDPLSDGDGHTIPGERHPGKQL